MKAYVPVRTVRPTRGEKFRLVLDLGPKAQDQYREFCMKLKKLCLASGLRIEPRKKPLRARRRVTARRRRAKK